jgi:hypothetical protein
MRTQRPADYVVAGLSAVVVGTWAAHFIVSRDAARILRATWLSGLVLLAIAVVFATRDVWRR